MKTGLRSRRARWAAAAAGFVLGMGIVIPAAARPDAAGQAGGPEDGPTAQAHGPRTAQDAGDAATGPLSAAAAATNLTYSTVDACRTFDSRLVGGPFGRGEGYFLNMTTACGLPEDGSVKAVMANVIAVNTSGTGYVRAAPYDPTFTAPAATVLNFNNNLVSSNAVPLTLCDRTVEVCDWDLDLWIPANATSNIVIDIVGYFS